MSKAGIKYYVNSQSVSGVVELWKSPVEKPVENVEKFGFSTGIPGLSNFRPC
jgi:hypothetical protein